MAKRPKTTPLSQKLNRDVFFSTSPDLPRIIEVDLVMLRPNPDQPRSDFNPASIQELADSVQQHGLIQPIAVASDPDNQGGFIVVAGERRYRAFQELSRETIPAIITTGAPDEIALIENIQRENLHPLDEARAINNLMQKHNYTHDEVSKVVGKARNTVTATLRLNTLPQLIRDECPTSDIPKSTLIEIARIGSEDEQLALWERVKHGGMTVREARAKKKGAPAPRAPRAPSEQALDAGNKFVTQLRKVPAPDLTPVSLMKLQVLGDQIQGILRQFADTTNPREKEKKQS